MFLSGPASDHDPPMYASHLIGIVFLCQHAPHVAHIKCHLLIPPCSQPLATTILPSVSVELTPLGTS
jgi:hypothetical protein